MPPKRAKPAGPKDLCVYLAEPNEEGVVQEELVQLVRRCVMDKIFSENTDHVAICRTDMTSSVAFMATNWDALRKVEKRFRETGEKGGKPGTFQALLDIVLTMGEQDKEDSYEKLKLLFFGHLKYEDLKEKDVTKLGKQLKNNKIAVSFILPDEGEMEDVQRCNVAVLKKVLECEHYEDNAYICSRSEATKEIFNTSTKIQKRAMPWNVVLEIGSELEINVSGFVCTRKNVQSELKKALVKDEKEIPASALAVTPVGTAKKTVVVELANTGTEKETLWKEKSGDVIDQDEIGKGYFYGDKLIPFNEVESDDVYKSGEKCLKVLLFCPRSKLHPAYQQGDGTTLFFPRKGDTNAELKFDALLQAMRKNDRVAIVRKVYRLNSKVNLGYLSPDVDRKCMVFGQLCFADDVSVPHFPAIIKRETEADEDGAGNLTSKEELMDEFILSQALDGFHPFEGPVDPAALKLRINVASRILDPASSDSKPPIVEDNIAVFFDKLMVKNELLDNFKETFPLKLNKEQLERLAGVNIFRKRGAENEYLAIKDTKKLKSEASEVQDSTADGDVEMEKVEDFDYDNLLDQM